MIMKSPIPRTGIIPAKIHASEPPSLIDIKKAKTSIKGQRIAILIIII